MYGTFLLVTFSDGTVAQINAGTDHCHNETWAIVWAKEIKTPVE